MKIVWIISILAVNLAAAEFPGSLTAVGCYKALPAKDHYKSYRMHIKWKCWDDLSHMVNTCAEWAKQNGFTMFGVQFYGECHGGPEFNAGLEGRTKVPGGCAAHVGTNGHIMVYKCAAEGCKAQGATYENVICDTDECADDSTNDCDKVNGQCVNEPGSYRCECFEGFALAANGKACKDINECENPYLNDCDAVNGQCVNIPGSFDCECNSGYTLASDGVTCEENNECLGDSHGCDTENGKCVNTLGSFKCSCNDGFKLGKDGKSCKDVDECSDKSHDCDADNGVCSNNEGSYECSCKDGFELDDDAKKCVEIPIIEAECECECDKNCEPGTACPCKGYCGVASDKDLCPNKPVKKASTCAEVAKQQGFPSISGAYSLETKSGEKFSVYCHFEAIAGCGKGPWTLVLRMKGSKKTFTYKSEAWTDKKVRRPSAASGGIKGNKETKLASYWNTPFKNICLGMNKYTKTRWVKMEVAANSMYDLIKPGKYQTTNVSKAAWKFLIEKSSLQKRCNKGGINVVVAGKKYIRRVRFGIISDQHNKCKSPNSFIGFGSSRQNTVGNFARRNKNPDKGGRNSRAIGYILVQ